MYKLFPLFLLLVSCGGGGGTDSPSVPTQGTVISSTCDGTTLVEQVADGNGGQEERRTTNSTRCGYTAPPTSGTLLDEYCEGYTLVTVTADGNGGELYERDEFNEEVCGYVPPQFEPEGTPYGDSYCAVELEEDPEYFDIVSEKITHLLREDRLQDYHDGAGGIYTNRLKHIDQTCFEQMSEPPACFTDATDTGHPWFDYLTCDGVKQKTGVSFPYDPDQYETAVIDMLVVFDNALDNEEDLDGMTVEEFIDKQIFESNHMYISSGTKTLVRRVGVVKVDVASGDLYRQYNAFFGGRYEFNGLDNWQREAGADIVFLFKKKPENPIACGVANLDATRGITKSRGITQCFHNSTFQENSITRYYERAHETFAHEIGHLLGAQHEWEDADYPGIFEYSFGYHLEGYNPQADNPDYEGIYGGYGTIMSYADLPSGRFSNYNQWCTFPEEAGEYAGQEVRMGTSGGCFCIEPIENQPPPTNNVETIARTRYLMSQLHELNHDIEGTEYGSAVGFNFSPFDEEEDLGALSNIEIMRKELMRTQNICLF